MSKIPQNSVARIHLHSKEYVIFSQFLLPVKLRNFQFSYQILIELSSFHPNFESFCIVLIESHLPSAAVKSSVFPHLFFNFKDPKILAKVDKEYFLRKNLPTLKLDNRPK